MSGIRVKNTLVLRQTFDRPINGYFDGGPKDVFDWRIEVQFDDGKTRVGSYGANHYFEVATGATEKLTLSNAMRKLKASAAKAGEACTFAYVEK